MTCSAWLATCFVASWLLAFIAAEDLGICSRCSIYILDLSSLANLHGFPTCDLSQLEVNPENGVVYLKGHGPEKTVDHKAGTHSAPWYLYKAIENSDCESGDIEAADLVYVYDYCYYAWWLAHVHSLGREHKETPGDYLIQGWTAMTRLPRWKRNGGRDFVFYDAHPGFASGQAAPTFTGMLCNELRHSTHIIVERAQRNICQSYLEISKQIITPYVPNVVDTQNPLDTFMRPSVPKSQRNISVFFSGKCIPFRGNNVGKRMRYATVQALKEAGQDTDVQCTENEHGHIHQEFRVMLEKMEHSVFCLVLPGDAQSTRRLSEIFMSGCIPVFLGPPYNSMPLPDDVNYKSVGVFFNITAYKTWMPTQMQWSIGSERAKYGQEARWWIPDADIREVMINVESIGDIMAHLRGMPDAEIHRKLKEMQSERLRFTFQGLKSDASGRNALQAISHRICEMNAQQGLVKSKMTVSKGRASKHPKAKVQSDQPLEPLDPDERSDMLGNGVLATDSSRVHQTNPLLQKFLVRSKQRGQHKLASTIAGAVRVGGEPWEPFFMEKAPIDIKR